MKKALRYWAQVAIATGVVIVNWVFVVEYLGLSYKQFDWAAFAGVYDDPYTPNFPGDLDDDGIADPDDPNPGVFDPSGCFYNRSDGRIVPGGSVAVSGPPVITVNQNGSGGCYQFEATNAGTFALAITLPPRCGIALDCPVQSPPPISPGNPASNCCTPHGGTGCDDGGCQASVCGIDASCCGVTWDSTCAGEARDLCTPVCDPTIAQTGPGPDPGNPGFLLGGGACTPWYDTVTLDYPGEGVIGNNIPLYCADAHVPAPAVSGWGWGALGLLLALVGLVGVRRQQLAPIEEN